MERRKDSKRRVLKEGEYQRENGTFEYRWRERGGKRRSVYAKSLEELRIKENDILRDRLDGINRAGENLSINDLYERWKNVKRGLKGNTFANYCYMFEMFVKPKLGQQKVVDLRRTDVRAFYNSLIEVVGLKLATVDNIHTVLHQVLEIAVEDDYLRYNPSDNALKELKRAMGREGEKRRALTMEEQELFEDYLLENTHNRWCPLFTVLLWTGMRLGELTGLRWSDINLEEGTISINHTLAYYSTGHKNIYEIHTPKTEAGKRIIPMLPKVKNAFLKEKQFQEILGLTSKDVINGYSDFIFINRFGSVMNQATLNRALRRIIKECNFRLLDAGKKCHFLPNFSCHTLRHTFTTRLCEAGVNIKVVQAILGHKDPEITLGVYAHATQELKVAELISFAESFENNRLGL